MAFGKGIDSAGGGAARLAALLVAAVALGLLAWRGASLLTRPPAPAAASAAEAALADLILPVVGPGLARLSVTYNSAGGRTVLILVDQGAADRIPELKRIAPIAAGILPEQGDRLVIETVAFAPGLPGRPGPEAWAELAALGLLVVLGGALALMGGQGQAAPQAVPQTLSPAAPVAERPREAPRPVRTASAPAQPEVAAADLARRDPARAAAVVRGWLTAKEDAS